MSLLPPLGTLAILTLLTPEYTAKTRLAIDAEVRADAVAAKIVATIESAAFLEKIVGRLALAKDPEFLFMPVSLLDAPWAWAKTHFFDLCGTICTNDLGNKAEEHVRYRTVADALRQRIGTFTEPEPRTLSISVRSSDPGKAALIADGIASEYVAESEQSARDADKRVAARFAEQVSTLRNSADAALQAATDYRQSGLPSDTEAKAVSRALVDLNAQLGQIQAQVLDRQTRISALQRSQASLDARGAAADLLTNPVIAALRVQESDILRRLLEVSQRYGENHPRVTEARAELGQVRGSIAVEARKIASNLDGELAAAQSREKQLQEQIPALEQRVRSSELREVELRRLERVAEKEQAAYRDMARRVDEVSEQQRRDIGTVRVLTRASTPEYPSYPRYVESVTFALVAGFLGGLLVIWLMESNDLGFRTSEQIERLTGRPLIGMVPALPRSALGKLTPVKYVSAKPVSVYAEALRSVHTSIALGAGASEPKVIMITSSVPGEGKSTFSCSLAELVARSNPGKKIIILDCDLRRPVASKLLDVPATQGAIDEYLSGTKELHAVIGRDERSGLYYIPAKIDTVNSAELLSSQKMRSLIDALASKFDFVFLDTPPLMAVADPRIIAQFADYIVYLVQWEKTNRDVAVDALKLIAASPKVGVVLSQVDLRRHARYGYADLGTYYSKYSSYYHNS